MRNRESVNDALRPSRLCWPAALGRCGIAAAAAVFVALAGCSAEPAGQRLAQDQQGEHAQAGNSREQFSLPDGIDPAQYVLQSEPEGAQDVIAIRETAEDEERVVVVGRIGGSENPWVEGRAAFNLVDSSLKACSDIPGDNCPAPWDYCCETHRLPEASVLVTIVDAEGKPVKADARALLDVKELSTVVVKGRAQRDSQGNLLVLGDGVHVREL